MPFINSLFRNSLLRISLFRNMPFLIFVMFFAKYLLFIFNYITNVLLFKVFSDAVKKKITLLCAVLIRGLHLLKIHLCC